MNFYFLPNALALRHSEKRNLALGDEAMDSATQDERTAVADYISDLAAELALMAAWAEHTELARILEMARLESEQLSGRGLATATEPALNDSGVAQNGADQSGPTNVILLSALRAAQR
jgi:hypothetical protein